MNKVLKYSLAILSAVAFICVTALIHTRVSARKHLITCNALNIEFRDSLHFVDEDDIKAYLENDCPVFIGQRIDSVDLCGMEKMLDSKSAILKSEVWASGDGTLNISISQREPVAMLKTVDHRFYIDDRGFIFPVQGEIADVQLIEGSIPLHEPKGYKGVATSAEGRAWIESMLKLLDYMNRSRKWNGKFEKISVLPGGDLTLKPREGRETFIFGKADGIEDKFARIAKYYGSIVPAVEKDRYATVSVKYKGQIVCRKK